MDGDEGIRGSAEVLAIAALRQSPNDNKYWANTNNHEMTTFMKDGQNQPPAQCRPGGFQKNGISMRSSPSSRYAKADSPSTTTENHNHNQQFVTPTSLQPHQFGVSFVVPNESTTDPDEEILMGTYSNNSGLPIVSPRQMEYMPHSEVPISKEERTIKPFISRKVDRRLDKWLLPSLIVTIIIFVLLLILVFVLLVLHFQDQENINIVNYKHSQTISVFKESVVLSSREECSQIGANLLESGGNAAEAAIATHICLGVTLPHRAGLGAGAFIIVYNQSNQVSKTYEGWFKSPYGLVSDSLLNLLNGSRIAQLRPDSSDDEVKDYLIKRSHLFASPGELYSLMSLYKDFGVTKSLDAISQPSIQLGENGFHFDAEVQKFAKSCPKEFSPEILLKSQQGKSRRPTYASVLESVFSNKDSQRQAAKRLTSQSRIQAANEAITKFYASDVTWRLIGDLALLEAGIVMADFQEYIGYSETLDSVEIGNLTVLTADLPSKGPALKLMLALLDSISFNLEEPLNSQRNLHYVIEAAKFAKAFHSQLGMRNEVESQSVIDTYLNPQFTGTLVKQITDASSSGTNQYGGISHAEPYYLSSKGAAVRTVPNAFTTVVDKHGLAVSILSSNVVIPNSCLYSQSTGLFLNDGLANFVLDSTVRSSLNNAAPHTNPLSGLIPLVATNSEDKSYFIVSPSGENQLESIGQLLTDIAVFDSNVEVGLSKQRWSVSFKNSWVRMGGSKDPQSCLGSECIGRPSIHIVKRTSTGQIIGYLDSSDTGATMIGF